MLRPAITDTHLQRDLGDLQHLPRQTTRVLQRLLDEGRLVLEEGECVLFGLGVVKCGCEDGANVGGELEEAGLREGEL